MARIATHVTEADVAAQHIAMSRELGLKTAGIFNDGAYGTSRCHC